MPEVFATVDMCLVDRIARKMRALEPREVAAALADELMMVDLPEEKRNAMLAKSRAERGDDD